MSSLMGTYYFNVKEGNRRNGTTIKSCDSPTEVSKILRRLETGPAKGLTRPIRVEVWQHRSVFGYDAPPIDTYTVEQWFAVGEKKYAGIFAATGQSSPLRHVKRVRQKIGTVRAKSIKFIKAQASKLAPAAILAFVRSLLGF
ncbi:MAG: hypothetical protein OXG78_04735 [Chloroflexi bacterium]|nr:hypothetical protein [Chloroflexota bacterium]